MTHSNKVAIFSTREAVDETKYLGIPLNLDNKKFLEQVLDRNNIGTMKVSGRTYTFEDMIERKYFTVGTLKPTQTGFMTPDGRHRSLPYRCFGWGETKKAMSAHSSDKREVARTAAKRKKKPTARRAARPRLL